MEISQYVMQLKNVMRLVGRLARNEPIWILIRDNCNAII